MFLFSLARCASLAVFAALASAPAFADEAPSPAPSSTASPSGALQEIGRVVTSDRRSEPLAQTSRPTFVVDRERIDAYGARTVADALQGVPGLDLFATGPFGAHVEYGIRGSTSAQTLVLVDGIPVADPTTGVVELGTYSTLGVDRIEVVESGTSTLYGTSAAGGVINIITRVPRGAYLAASAGSFADRDARAAIGDGRFGFSYERHVATSAYPYPAFAYSPAVSFPAGVRENSFGDASAGRFSADLPLGGGFRVRARADAQDAYVGVPSTLEFPSLTATETTSNNSALLELERAGATSTFTLSLAGSQTRLAYDDPSGFPPGEQDTYTGRSQVSLKEVMSGAHADAIVGVDLSRETGNFTFPAQPQSGAPAIPPSATGAAESQSAAYLQLGTSPLAGTRFTAGLRAENDAPHGTVLAPSFGGVIRSGSLRFAGNVGESFRVPTLEDLYYPGFSNPNLLPEKAQTADVTVAYEAAGSTLSVGWFDRNGSNFIVAPAPDFLPINVQRAASAGFQVTASSKPFYGLVAEASLTDLYRALDLTTNGRLPHQPALQTTLSLGHPFGRDRFSYGVRWAIVGSDGDDTASVPPPLTGRYDAYDSLDAYLRYKLAKDTVLTFRAFNLGDEARAPVFGYPATGRRLYVEVSTR